MRPLSIDSAAFRALLVQGDVRAWLQLHHALRSKFHCQDCGGYSADDFLQEALLRFQACLVVGRVDPEKPLTPFILAIARNIWLDAVRRHARRASIANGNVGEIACAQGFPEDGTLHETPASVLERQECEEGLVAEGEPRAEARDTILRVLDAFRKTGPGDSFRFLQALVLPSDELNRAWQGSTRGTSLRTTQRQRQRIIKQAVCFAMSKPGAG